MAHSKISLKHPKLGTIKSAPVGFSWTTFFFGFFPALFRGDVKWAAIIFFSTALAGYFTFGLSALVTGVIFGFIYNKNYIRDLVANGYIVENVESAYDIVELQRQVEVVLTHNNHVNGENMEAKNIYDATKKCPYCAEDVKLAAVICKHCGKDISEKNSPAEVVSQIKQAIKEGDASKVKAVLENNPIAFSENEMKSVLTYAEIYFDKNIMSILHQRNIQ